MTIERRSGAPRLIEWTGERFVPWTPDAQVAYEHYHRYLWATELVVGRRVLDLASGEGFGSAILAGVAQSVVGVDNDTAAIEHSRVNYAAENLEFRVGSALDLSEVEPGSFDAVVCFEMIEHVTAHDELLQQVDRVLADDGLFIASTPERRLYSRANGQDNPFHERELSEPEFRALLGSRFAHAELWGQRTIAGSYLAHLGGGSQSTPLSFFIERAGDSWQRSGAPAPMYLVAVASRQPFDAPPAESTLADSGLELMRQFERDAVVARTELARAQEQAEQSEQHTRRELETIRQAVADGRAEQQGLTRQLVERGEQLTRLQADNSVLTSTLGKIEESVTWSLFQRARGRLYGTVGRGSIPGRIIQASLRTVGQLTRATRRSPVAVEPVASGAAPHPPIRFPVFERPVVSIVIPIHGQADLTFACLRAIEHSTDSPAYEVVLVNDAADEATQRLIHSVENATVIVNDENLGFLRSMNRGTSVARGDHLVLLNNDTEVQPGWLQALVDQLESAPDIGIVAPKLLFPDGRLQEAGGIVFQDGSAWNFGRDDDPDLPQYNYVRDVDYGSGACLLVRATLFSDLNGFDERYAPAYYEDADLGFEARRLGYRVVFEPRSRVIHVEGASSGTDLGAGVKRYQTLNQPKFEGKWRAELRREQLRSSPAVVRRASDRNRGPQVLVIDHRIPTPDRDAGSLRMRYMMRSLQRHGARVTFLPDDLSALQPYTEQLQAEGVEVLHGAIDVPNEIASIGPHMRLAIVSRPYVAGRYIHLLRAHAPGAVVAYDTVDLHYIREARRAALTEAEGALSASDSVREIELGLVRATDTTIVVTENERQHLLSEIPEARVDVVPVANEIAASVPPPDGRKDLLFVGGFQHPPNIDAVEFLVRSIMPVVWRRIGDVGVSIVGADPPPSVQALSSPGIDLLGWVKDMQPLLDGTRVMVAPLRYGAGMKGKVTQSLAAGLPVVTTSIGAEGLGAKSGRDMLIADTPDEFADCIVRLYEDDTLWRELSAGGQAVVKRVCSPAAMDERVGRLVPWS